MAGPRENMARRHARGYIGFQKLEGELGQRPGVKNPKALTAWIGRRKHGKRAFQSAAARGVKLGGR